MSPAGFLQLDHCDAVAVALSEPPPGSPLPGGAAAATTIPAGHKTATRRISRGEQVTKYGQVIGVATADIRPGEHVHTHNLAMLDFERNFERSPPGRPDPPNEPAFLTVSAVPTAAQRQGTISAS